MLELLIEGLDIVPASNHLVRGLANESFVEFDAAKRRLSLAASTAQHIDSTCQRYPHGQASLSILANRVGRIVRFLSRLVIVVVGGPLVLSWFLYQFSVLDCLFVETSARNTPFFALASDMWRPNSPFLVRFSRQSPPCIEPPIQKAISTLFNIFHNTFP